MSSLWWSGLRKCSALRKLRPLLHLLLPLSIHWVAEEMTVSVLVDVTSAALCHRKKTCSKAININGVRQTIARIFKMVVLALLGQLSDKHGRKPLLLITMSATIIPFALLAWQQTEQFVYAYYVLRTISCQGSIFCISIAYAKDVVNESKRKDVVDESEREDVVDESEDENEMEDVFCWVIGLFSASHVVGNVLARFLPKNCIFVVSIALLIFCPLYMQFFFVETVIVAPKENQESGCCTKIVDVLHQRYKSMREAAKIVILRPTLRGLAIVSFFYELGMSGISSVLLYYLKAVFGFKKSQFSELLIVVRIGSIFSKMLLLRILKRLVGEKMILCSALLASIAFAWLCGLAWAPWVPYLGACFGVIFTLVKPSTDAIISQASRSTDKRKAKTLIAATQSVSHVLSPIAMSPLTSWFLSSNAPFDCKGFSIICASICMIISLYFACLLKPDAGSSDDIGSNQEPLHLSDDNLTESEDFPIMYVDIWDI